MGPATQSKLVAWVLFQTVHYNSTIRGYFIFSILVFNSGYLVFLLNVSEESVITQHNNQGSVLSKNIQADVKKM